MDLSHVLLRVSLVLCVLGRKTTEVKCPPRSLIQSTCHQHDSPPMMLTWVIWLRQCLSGFSIVKFLFPPILWFWGESHCAQPTLGPWGVTVHTLEGALIHTHDLDSCTDCSLFSHYIRTDSWIYILHFGLYFNYYLIYFVAQCFSFYSLLCNK